MTRDDKKRGASLAGRGSEVKKAKIMDELAPQPGQSLRACYCPAGFFGSGNRLNTIREESVRSRALSNTSAYADPPSAPLKSPVKRLRAYSCIQVGRAHHVEIRQLREQRQLGWNGACARAGKKKLAG